MEITEVRIKLMDAASDRLRGFCSITFDDSFVVRDLKIIEGTSGPFVAMPSRKLTAHCPQCNCKNSLKAPYCNQCGFKLPASMGERGGAEGRAKLYADIAHPINSECREMIQTRVIEEYKIELGKSEDPNYRSRYDDYYDDDDDVEDVVSDAVVTPTPPKQEERPAASAEKKIQQHPAEPKVQGPHQGQTQSRNSGGTPHTRRKKYDFGEGVFED
ncbi:MAG: stage V sporulation protein G [Blastopirellula sp.]|nr:MAG: stage V sporulation protein G [Blastopirellula sp.]